MRAILSVSDKAGLVELGRGLIARNVQLISTGGTSKALADAGLAVTNVSDVTGFPEMMDGRVKTLHPKVHGGILARRHRPDDLAAIAAQGIEPIDLVVVNLYPFEKAARNPDTPFDDLVEQIDIGGPVAPSGGRQKLPRRAGRRRPGGLPARARRARATRRAVAAFRFELMQKAFAHTAQSTTLIAMTLGTSIRVDERRPVRASGADEPAAAKRDLRYGENPHQKAVVDPRGHRAPSAPGRFTRARSCRSRTCSISTPRLRIALEFTEPAAVVIKHTNPCGVATGASIAEAYVRARDADPLSAFGGIVGLNRPLDADDGAGDHVHLHRGGDRAVGRRRRASDAGGEDRTCGS